jgi:hypothetical protein
MRFFLAQKVAVSQATWEATWRMMAILFVSSLCTKY